MKKLHKVLKNRKEMVSLYNGEGCTVGTNCWYGTSCNRVGQGCGTNCWHID